MSGRAELMKTLVDFTSFPGGVADEILQTLADAGYRLLGPDEAKALEGAVFKLVSDAYGLQVADDLAKNKWAWPKSGPRLINPTVFSAVAAIRALAEREG